MRSALLAACLALGVAAAAWAATPPPAGAGAEWPTTGGDAGGTHYSRLTDIGPGNIARLGLAWSASLGTTRVLEATPVVTGGTLYTSGVAGRVYAFDAATGRELWRFVPPIDMQVNRVVCCDMANRGVAVAGGRVFVATLDGWLYALEARSGRVAWKTDTIVDHSRGYSSTGAPELAGDLIIIGNAGGDYDARGYVSAYERSTGRLRWRFWIVPRNPELGPQEQPHLQRALSTWNTHSRWDVGGGGASWDAIQFDPETGLVLIGTGNGEPYDSNERSPDNGDQLYLASIVALDARTGRMRWHYQETPRDSWDYESTEPIILAHLRIDGVDRAVVLHAPKNGFLYVLDRSTGELLRANPIVRTNWARSIDKRTGRPVIDTEAADYHAGPRIIFPATPGARNWHPAGFDPDSGLYYAPVLDMGNLMFIPPGPKPYAPRSLNTDAALIFGPDIATALQTLPPPLQEAIKALPAWAETQREPFRSEVRAIDPLTGQARWAAPMQGWQDRGGVLVTASHLLFQGSIDGTLRVFDSRSGQLLRSIDTGTSMLAAPMTYRIGGTQYVAVMAAWGGGGFPYVPAYAAAYKRGNEGRLLVFRLDGGPVPLPPELPALEVAPPAPAQAAGVTDATIAQGRGLFFANCAICHANQHRSITPDLRRMQPGTHELFDRIVRDGLLVPNGMPRWDDRLSAQDVAAIHAYLIDLQDHTHRDELARQAAGVALDAPSAAILSNY